ncbi:phospho-sugar glycosidase domain-containing protein, partial [Brachyspira pilosicoli]
ALKDIKNTGRTNVVGRVDEEYLFLLDYINMAQRFKITE